MNISNNRSIDRHLSLFDLVSIGVGGTIGSGIFVLCGHIARNYAGPASILSWILSGIAACLSGLAYAELAGQIPAAGSSYIYAYVSMGELPAVLAAACLTLEYVVSGSAVARSWGDKVVDRMITSGFIILHEHNRNTYDDDHGSATDDFDSGTATSTSTWLETFVRPGFWNFNPLATVIATVSVLILLSGVKESKAVTNFFTVTKVLLVSFMTILGLILIQPSSNLVPFLPPQFGYSGVVRGATSSFFGYIGFDEICCLAGEAKDPRRNVPRAIVLTLACVTVLYVLATFALVGMQPYQEISDVSGFPMAFQSRGLEWAARLSAFGEIFTLPIVVLLSTMAQPRLQYALAKDGLLPSIFARTDSSGNLWYGTLISGILMISVASFVPFDLLNDVISAGILVAFCTTDSALLLLKHDPPPLNNGCHNYEEGTGGGEGNRVEWLVGTVNVSAFTFGITTAHLWDAFPGSHILAILSAFGTFAATLQIYRTCPPVQCFGGKRRFTSSSIIPHHSDADRYFQTPCMPFVPCLGIFVNWYLLGQLELVAIALLVAYLFAAVVFYFCYGFWHSVGNHDGWLDGEDSDDENFSDRDGRRDGCGAASMYVERTLSLPRVSSKPVGSTGTFETTYMT